MDTVMDGESISKFLQWWKVRSVQQMNNECAMKIIFLLRNG